jgi:phenylalanyl-tRNA synthetase beta chain
LALRSEASSRFEKQLSPDQTLEAQIVATSLMIDLCGAKVAPGTIDIGAVAYKPATIRLRDERTAKLLGAEIPRERAAEILEQLGFSTTDASDGLDVAVPHFRRYDITREADLIEEVARVWGMDKLPSTLPSTSGAAGRLSKDQKIRRRAENTLADAGLFEVIGWSFISPDLPDRLNLASDDPRRDVLVVANPMSEEQAVMRTTLLSTVLEAARDNRARGRGDLRFFEIGVVYFKQTLGGSGTGKLPAEHQNLAVLLSGEIRPRSWHESNPITYDFFSAKAVLANLLDTLRLPWRVKQSSQPFLHPGRSAEVYLGEKPIGWIGELHPNICEEWEIPPSAAFEINFDEVATQAGETPLFENYTAFPPVRQDIAVILEDSTTVEQVMNVVETAGKPMLQSASIFDLYRGGQVGSGRYSLAIRLEFSSPERTLTDDEVAKRRDKIVAALAAELNGELRG